jgi:Helicase conserved C-terminal domain
MARDLGADLAGPTGFGAIVSPSPRIDPAPVMAGLKDFQRRTVNYVFRRLYEDDPPAYKFLVADEVGLGKTLVARGLIARSIERLQAKGVKRIDIVYICSNADIARQNVNRLNVTEVQEFNLPTRITMLPIHLRQLKEHGINFVSFTPGTSFDLKSRGGMLQERALLYRLLSHAWGWSRKRHAGVFRVLQGNAALESFRRAVRGTPGRIGTGENQIDPELAKAFREELAREEERARNRGGASLRERFEELADRCRRARNEADWHACQQLVGDLRHALALSCVSALEPDLVILDEFQRFRQLLDGEDPAAELAQCLFNQENVRVLLLSATPYKMYTLSDEAQDDHWADFVQTVRFLMGEAEASKLEANLRDFRHAVLDLDTFDLQRVLKHRKRVERRLRRVMCRTERLSVKTDRNGMLSEHAGEDLRLTPNDLTAYLATDAVSRLLASGDVLEYWKSAPYLLNFMEGYKLKRSFHDAASADARTKTELARILAPRDGLISMQDIEDYDSIDPGNPRLRALFQDCLDSDAWRLLWLPPSLPYYELGRPFNGERHRRFTKRLIFSAWWVVPQVIATLASYEAERRMMCSDGRNRKNTPLARRRIRPLLRFQRQPRRIAGMSLFALIYPSPTLARLADPLRLGAELGPEKSAASIEDIVTRAERRLARAIRSIVPKETPRDGPVDERWYWAAPLLLDAQDDGNISSEEWLSRREVPGVWSSDSSDSDDSALSDVVACARETIADKRSLGRVPVDLKTVLARLAVAAPAVCALRSLARAAGGTDQVADVALRDGAARVAWGFRSLFNTPEVMAMLRGGKGEEDAYWQKVLDYCLNGCLQAVLDEYAHVLRESLVLDRDPQVIGCELAQGMYDALTIRAVNYRVDPVEIDKPGELDKNLRARFALRFGSQGSEETGEVQRGSQVRAAFNSPFWPFILATTSVGQEGLDFHLYCHAVVHWNLPANPVDLEQREGRIHRYKGHAVRKNVASANRLAGFNRRSADPWDALFHAAARSRGRGVGDLVPYWVYATLDGARIERHVPSLPLSREVGKLEQLKRSLAVYRLAFGQPRQADLEAYLEANLARFSDAERLALVGKLRIDLSP